MNRMNLFNNIIDSKKNQLPYNGQVYFYGCIFSYKEINYYYNKLLKEVEWKHDEAIIFGKHIVTKRKIAWYADENYSYAYSKITRKAQLWNDLLIDIKLKVEKITGETYNSCLLNLYHDGSEGMAWHSDAEKELVKNGSIASLSLGATRKFVLKHNRTKDKIVFNLGGGELLEMKGEIQSYWKHTIPKSKKVHYPRINLTFRQIK